MESEGSSRPLRQLWSSYMSCSLAINSQEKNKHLKTFMIEFLKMYHAVKGDVSKMSNFGDIHSISNVLTSEFQAAILLRCHEGAEVSLVQYLCHGEGLLLLQMLCILANKIAGCSLDLANLLVSLLPVILSLPLREYDSLYGLELIITDFDDYYQDSKSTSHHSTVAKEMILSHIQTCYKSNEHVERGISSRRTHGKRQEVESVQLENTEIQIDDEGANRELSCAAKAVAESSSATEDSDVFTSVTSVTDSASANVSDCSDNNGIDGSNLVVALCKESLDDGIRASSVSSTIVGDAENQESSSKDNEPEGQARISNFDLALLLVSTLENIACHGGSALQDPALLMHTSGQLINILLTLKDPKEKSVDVLCEWDTAAFYGVQLVILRTVFAILFTACKNPKSAKQLSKSSYVEKILEVVESSLDKDFLTKQQQNDLVNLVATMDGHPGDQKLRTADLWFKFQHELFLGCLLQGVLLFVTSCLNHGTVVNSSLMVLCQDLFEQFSASGGFECVSSLLMKLDEALLQESRTSALSEKVERSFVPSAHKIEQYPRNLTHQVVRNLGKMISLLKKGKNHCTSAAELSNKRSPAKPVAQDEDYVMCDVYPQSSEVEESSESAADMECENERQRKFSGDLCPVSRPILTLLATFKESRTSELRMHVLCCLGKVGICHCISPDQLITPLLNRFVDQPKDIQGAVLKEINHLVLTEIDVMDGKFQTAQLHSSYPKGLQRTFSTKQNATKSDSGFSASDFSATGIATQAKGLCKETGASWTCLSQYCSLMTSTDSSVAVEVTRSLKAMATLGSRQLKGELFRTVVLPCILRYGGESAFGESHGVGEALRNTRARSWTGPFSPEWLEVRKKSVKRSTLSASDETFGDVFLSGQSCVEDGVSKEVLHLCISYLTALLIHQPSRELFLSCGGLNELQGFLVLPELQEPVLCVLEFLANVEDEEKSQKVHKAESGELSAGSPETSSEERTEGDACCLSLLSLLHYTTQSLQRKRNPSENTSGTADMSLYHHAESTLRVHVWRSCLQLLVSNTLFRELFVQDDGMLYSYDLLHFLFGAFQSCSSGSEFVAVDTHLDDALFVRDLVSLFESVLPVCIRMAHTEQWQNTESLPSLDQLMQDAKKTASKSDLLRRFLGKRMSDSLLKALVWQFGRGADGAQWSSEIKQQREAVLRKTSNGDGQEEWLPTVEEDEETGGNQKNQRATLEAGYDADQEGDSDSSDVGEQRPVRNRKLPRERRKTEESKEQHCLRGLIIYPQICSFLFELMQVCYDCELCTSDSSSLPIVVHAVQSFLVLLKDCEQNRKILCQQGVIGTILECFHDVLISRDQAVQGIQSLVLDVFVCLASHSIRAAELWDFLSLFNSPAPPVNFLSAALSEVAAKVSFHPGPAYVISFPCYGKGGEVWTKQTSRGATAKLKQGKGKRFVRSKGQSPHGSDGDASSEDPGMNSGSSPSRSRLLGSPSLEKQQLKRAASKTLSLLEGGKRRGTAKRRVRKHSWSHSGASGNSGDHELREVVELEHWAKLPSPFVVRAVQLPFLGSLPRSKRGFSLAMWICLTSPSLGSEVEAGAGTESRGGFGGGTSRISSPRRERILHLCSIGSGKRLFEAWIAPSDGSFLFRWTRDHKGSSKALSVLRETPVRVAAFKKGQWHHVVVSFTQPKVSAEDEKKLDRDSFPPSKLLIVVDGTECTVHDFGPPLPWHEEAKFTLSTLLLGHVIDSESCKPANVAASLQDGYELGNVFVFTGKSSKAQKHTMNESMPSTDFLVGQEEAFYLYSLGPNCTSMGQLSKDFKLVTQQPHHSTQPLLEAASLWSRLSITEQAVATDLPPGFLTSPHVVIPDLEAFVKKRLAAVYSPAFPVIFHQYAELLTSEDRQGRPSSVTEPSTKANEYESTEMTAKVTSGVEPYRRQTLLESAHDVGGISVFIYLFAKVVEQTTDEKTQADILSVVLSLQYSSAFHARAMAEESGFALLKRILLTPECRIGYHTLKVLMEAACDGDVFKPTSLADDPVMLNIDSTAVVRNVAIFQHFLLNWKIWEKAKQGVLDMLLATIDILVHGSHCYYQFNIVQFQKAQLVQQILIGCQERQGECCKEIPRAISSLYVNIVQNIMGCPPDLTVLKAVCEFLIAMHPTEDTTRLHSPNRFYLREHSLDFDFTADWAFSGSSSVPRRFRQSPRTVPVRSLQSSNPFHFKSPEKHPPRNAMSRSLSFESLERKDALGTLGNKGGEGKGVLGSAPISNKRSSSAYGLNRSFPSVVGEEPDSSQHGAEYGQSNPSVVTSSAEFETQQRNLSVDEGLASTAIASLGEDKNSADRKSSVGLSRSFSEESSALLLHEGHFGEPGFRGTPSPVRSPGTSLVMSYPGMRSVLGSKPVVIRNYGSTPSRDGQSSVDPMEYDFINESDFSSLRSSVANPPSSNDDYLVVEGFPGIQSSTMTYCPTRSDGKSPGVDAMIKLRLGLMKLLEKVLFTLPSEHVPAVIGEVLKAEYMLVWAYHDADSVRELAIRILFQYLQKAEPKRCEQFLRIYGFHLLANQLYDHSVTKLLIEGCLSLLVARQVDLKKDYDYSSADDRDLSSSVRPMGVVPLLALLENSVLKPSLFHLLIQHLCQLFIRVDDLCLKAVEHGLLETFCNVVYGLCTLRYKQRLEQSAACSIDLDSITEDVQQFVACIVRKACSTNGNLYFQMFEDLMIALENLEEQDHKKRDYDPCTSHCARHLRFFAVQVALHFFQEVSKGEGAVSGKKTKPSGIRLPFRGPDKNADPVPAFTPESSWVNLDRDTLKSCLDPSQLKKSPTNANFNEQTRRFQNTCQLAVSFIVQSKTFFLPEGFVLLDLPHVDLQVHAALRPAIVRVAGAAIEKEFAQFVFSLLVEILDACLDGRKREMNKLFIVSKDVLKMQVGKLLVFLLNPSQDLDLSCFALHLVHHPRVKKILETVLTSSGGPKLRERVAVYLLKLLAHPGLTDEQRETGEMFKVIMLSSSLQSLRLNSTDWKITCEEEMQLWDSADKASMMQWQKQRTDAYRRLVKRTDDLNEAISTVAKDVTRVVVEIQDSKRQALLKHTRDALSAEVQIRKKWRQLIERLIHERSVWHDPEHFPCSWRLDPTEGPGRVRCRLQRFHLDVDDVYLMEENRGKKSRGGGTPLSYLFEDTTTSRKKHVYYIFDTPDTIRFLHHCKNITLDNKIKGVLLIGESHVYFVGEEATADADITQILLGNKDAISISWSYEEIQEIRTRRHTLQDNALEIFLTTGRTYLLAFETKEDRETVLVQFKQRNLPCYETPQHEHLQALTTRWRCGQMTNFEYLTELNKMAGRSFNDLMQYPVFPFVLADFSRDVLDLTEAKTFRELSRPIAVQNQSKERKYRETFRWLQEEYERMNEEEPMSKPYHYGCHYSNSGTVLHFLVRLPPFTKMFLQYQDRSFDIPDRTFHSMATTWRLSSFESATDVKELIPEFFFLPDFLENTEGFNFGVRQNGQRVINVELPQWAKGSTRLFTLIHRQALESDYVSQHLNQWIDLVFGYKQMGPEAVEAINVFHPATYYGVDVNAITDPVRQKALKTMIETYGQTPQQLFTFPHSPKPVPKNYSAPPSEMGSISGLNTLKFVDPELAFTGSLMSRFTTSISSDTGTVVGSIADTITEVPMPVNTVEGLKWGQYVGSPGLGAPAVVFTQALNATIQTLVYLKHDTVFALSHHSTLLTLHQLRPGESEERLVWSAALSWGYMDGCLRVCTSPGSAPVRIMEHHTPDKITCCAVTDGCKSLFIGTSTGTLSVLPVKYNPSVESGIEFLGSRIRLYGHKDAITCIQVCQAFSIVVSGSCDKTAIIWDLNRFSYVRFLEHSNTVAAVAISRTSGDIATVSHTADYIVEEDTMGDGSVMRLWTVNGRFIGHVTCEPMINCLDFSCAPEGVAVNVIATGLSNGAIRLWSTWDLRHIRDIAPDQNLSEVACLAFSVDSQLLLAVNTHGKLVVWQRRDKPPTKLPTITVFPRA